MQNFRPLSRLLLLRYHSTSSVLRSSWSPGPSPPRLPPEEQEIFERLQRQSSGAFSTPRADEPASSSSPPTATTTQPPDSQAQAQATQQPSAAADGDELHPHVRRGAPPEFEGDRNPKTGEIGGPKNEPLRWGTAGDWSFNGRVTDF